MYIILEMQTDANGNTAVLPAHQKADRKEADGVYHQILSVAATSTVPVHSAFIVDEYGNIIRSEYYTHEQTSTETETKEEA